MEPDPQTQTQTQTQSSQTQSQPKGRRHRIGKHSKSRTGCVRCRARRVKCNEQQPTCNNCHRHGVACVYDRKPAPSPSPSLGNASSASTHGTQAPDGRENDENDDGDILGRAITELRVLHHYTVATSVTLPGAHEQTARHRWSVQIPRLAMAYEPLLSQILSFSALHLIRGGGTEGGALDPDPDPALPAFRQRHGHRALEKFRHVVVGLNEQTADATCFTSVLLLFDAFAALADRPLHPYEPPMGWMRVTKGSRDVVERAMEVCRRNLDTSVFMEMVNSGRDTAVPSAEMRAHARRLMPHFFDNPRMAAEHEPGDPALLAAYREAAEYVGAIRVAMDDPRGEPVLLTARRLMSLPIMVPARWIDAIAERRPLALVILAHFFALAAHASGLWWIAGTPRREFNAIRDNTPPQLQYLLEWPIRNLP